MYSPDWGSSSVWGLLPCNSVSLQPQGAIVETSLAGQTLSSFVCSHQRNQPRPHLIVELSQIYQNTFLADGTSVSVSLYKRPLNITQIITIVHDNYNDSGRDFVHCTVEPS